MNVSSVINAIAAAATRPLNRLGSYYSTVLQRPLSLRQTFCLLNAQMAFLATVFIQTTAVAHVALLTWFVASVLKCREVL